MDSSAQNVSPLGRDLTLGSLTLFTLPTIFSYFFIAAYQIADGIFIERFVGPYAISAVNLFYPVVSLLLAMGLMLGSGGCAMASELTGAGKKETADRVFSQTLTVAFLIGLVLAVLGLSAANPMMELLGASQGNIGYLRPYYLVLTVCAPAILLQNVMASLLMSEGQTLRVGVLTAVGGLTNIVLDIVFMKYFHWGVFGAGLATALGYLIPVLYGVWYCGFRKGGGFHFRLCRLEPGRLLRLCWNGSSEMVSNLAAGVTALFMNRLAARFYGDVGVSVVSVYLYVQFLAMAVFMGMTTATEPLFSYRLGSGDVKARRKLLHQSLALTTILTVIITVLLALFRRQAALLFFQPNQDGGAFYSLTCESLLYAVPACLFVGYNIFISGLFTAFSNGTISALLSGLRTLVLLTICIFGLSALLGSRGLWLSWAAAEALALVVSLGMLLGYRKRYFQL